MDRYPTKRLVPVLREWSPPGTDVHAILPQGGVLIPKTRVFLDLLVSWFERHGRSIARVAK